MDTPRTLLEAVKFFSVPQNCLEYLVARRWPNGRPSLGPITRFATSQTDLNAAGLATCNQDHK